MTEKRLRIGRNLTASVAVTAALYNISSFDAINYGDLWVMRPVKDQSLTAIARENHEGWVRTSMLLYLTLQSQLATRKVYVDSKSELTAGMLKSCCWLDTKLLNQTPVLSSEPSRPPHFAEMHKWSNNVPVEVRLYETNSPVYVLRQEDGLLITDNAKLMSEQ